jgi:hypothetical protein
VAGFRGGLADSGLPVPVAGPLRGGHRAGLLTRGLYQDNRDGIVTRGQPAFRPAVTMAKTSQGTAEAKVTDCLDDSRTGTYYKSGKPAAGQPPGRHLVYAWLQPFDGT